MGFKSLYWLLVFFCLTRGVAYAAVCTIPVVFVNGQPSQATDINTNFAALVACVNTIDNTNIGSAGISASNINSFTTAQATFGGSVAYTFPAFLTTGPLSVSGTTTVGTLSAPAILVGNATVIAAYTPAGGLINTKAAPFKSVTLSGVTGSVTSQCFTGFTAFCAVFTLSGNAKFSSGGSTTTAPSFECGGVFSVLIVSGVTVFQEPQVPVSVVASAPNTIYVASPLASTPVLVQCYGY